MCPKVCNNELSIMRACHLTMLNCIHVCTQGPSFLKNNRMSLHILKNLIIAVVSVV